MDYEEEHLDIIHNIESVVISIYRERRDLTDYEVDKAYAAIYQSLRNEQIGKPPVIPSGELTTRVYDGVTQMINWRLGRSTQIAQKFALSDMLEPVSVEVVMQCLKQLRKSIELWSKEGGRQGYLFYISQFL